MSNIVRLKNNGSGALYVPSLQTSSLESNILNLTTLNNGYLKTSSGSVNSLAKIPITDISLGALSNGYVKSSSGVISSESTIPIGNINSNALSNGYMKSSSGSVSSLEKIPIADISLGALSNGVLFKSNGDVTSGVVDISNLSSTLQTRLNTIESDITTLQSDTGGSGETLSLDDSVFQIENSNTLNIPNFGKNWYQLASTPSINSVSVSCSGNGQYIIISAWSNSDSQLSKDFGNTWRPLTTIGRLFLHPASISATGQYMCMNMHSGGIYISSNYGETWNIPNGTNSPNGTSSSSISSTGKYILCSASSATYMSSDYGVNWIRNTSFTNGVGSALSHDGKIGYVTTVTNIWKTTDSGANWTSLDFVGDSFGYVSCSGSGKYVLISPSENTSGDMYISSNYGQTFTTATGSSRNYFRSTMSSSGRYMTVACKTGFIYSTSNYGITWSQSSSISQAYYGVAMSHNASIIYAQSNATPLYVCNSNISTLTNSAPVSAGTGSTYFDESNNKLYIYNSTSNAWKSVTLS